MKLRHECVRDVLLAIEAHDEVNPFLFDTDLKPMLKKTHRYSENDLNYTILQLIDAGFLDARSVTNGGYIFQINKITWAGHQFLDNIKDNDSWKKAKEKALTVGGAALPIIAQFAWDIAKERLGIN